ncbi:MAG: hypothetical protein RR776_13125 [Niameybacter sp.]|uniref:hypothetical protein n=1 Tax=Niameybacter sp. TaxID=2033640 RepID=UPI002FC9AD2A
MKHYYSTVDGVILTHSDIEEKNFLETITLHFERAREKGGFDIAEIILPNYNFTKVMGFTEDDTFELEEYAKNNAPLIWELAKEHGGINNA